MIMKSIVVYFVLGSYLSSFQKQNDPRDITKMIKHKKFLKRI